MGAGHPGGAGGKKGLRGVCAHSAALAQSLAGGQPAAAEDQPESHDTAPHTSSHTRTTFGAGDHTKASEAAAAQLMLDPGLLTDLRSVVVSNKRLAQVAARSGLHR